MKLKVLNKGQYPVERLGYTFVPGIVQEIEVTSHEQYLAVKARVCLEVTKIEEVAETVEEVIEAFEEAVVEDKEEVEVKQKKSKKRG